MTPVTLCPLANWTVYLMSSLTPDDPSDMVPPIQLNCLPDVEFDPWWPQWHGAPYPTELFTWCRVWPLMTPVTWCPLANWTARFYLMSSLTPDDPSDIVPPSQLNCEILPDVEFDPWWPQWHCAIEPTELWDFLLTSVLEYHAICSQSEVKNNRDICSIWCNRLYESKWGNAWNFDH